MDQNVTATHVELEVVMPINDVQALQRERDELRAEITRLQFDVTEWQERCERLSVEAGKLAVENDELRAAVERLRMIIQEHIDAGHDHLGRLEATLKATL